MTAKGKIIKIGFDLDGVIIDKPPLIPKKLIEWLYRGRINTELSYRFPNTKIERYIRWLSHHPILRPPIKKNIKNIQALSKNKKYRLYAISSRYGFLEKRTKEWLDFYKLNDLFDEVHLNLDNNQPHKYKEKMINKLKINVFVDDDPLLINFLRKKIVKTDFFQITIQRKELEDLF